MGFIWTKKVIFLALLFTEVLKFALLKSSQIKFRKSKISCDRMNTQKKSLFPELKRKFQILNIQAVRPRKVSGISKITLDWKSFS